MWTLDLVLVSFDLLSKSEIGFKVYCKLHLDQTSIRVMLIRV